MSFIFRIHSKDLMAMPAKLTKFKTGLESRRKKTLDRIGQEVAGHSRDKYLSGPRSSTILGVVDNRLRPSVTHGFVGANSIEVGTNVGYGKIHELGDRPFLRTALADKVDAITGFVQDMNDAALKEAFA